jgi:hypothetical protein
MSIRAHRIIKIEYAPGPTFNCWHDTELLDFLLENDEVHDGRNLDGAGIIEFNVDELQAAVDDKNLKLNDEVRRQLQADIVASKVADDEYIQYDCF